MNLQILPDRASRSKQNDSPSLSSPLKRKFDLEDEFLDVASSSPESRDRTATPPAAKRVRHASKRNVDGVESKSKRPLDARHQQKVKRAKILNKGYSDDLQLLYDSESKQALTPVNIDDLDEEDDLEESYIGATFWTAKEKHDFFDAITRYGNDVHRVASVVGKTAFEISLYVNLLEEGAKLQRTVDGDIDLTQINAAVEFSPQFNDAFESAADSLAWEHFKREIEREIQLYGHNWLMIDEDKEDEVVKPFLTPKTAQNTVEKRAYVGFSCTNCRHRRKRCDRAKPYCGECSMVGKASTCHYPEAPYTQWKEKPAKCGHCVRRKTKCDRARPVCSTCIEKGRTETCFYEDHPRYQETLPRQRAPNRDPTSRRPRACAVCNRRKSKCDRVRPTCSACVRRNTVELCVYADDPPGGKDQQHVDDDDVAPGVPTLQVEEAGSTASQTPLEARDKDMNVKSATAEQHAATQRKESQSSGAQKPAIEDVPLASIENQPQDDATEQLDNLAKISTPGAKDPLLKRNALLWLSKYIYMNSSDRDLHWETHLETFPIPREVNQLRTKLNSGLSGPALFRSAYNDLTDLAECVTKRLLATAQYQAQSRTRMYDNVNDPAPEFVTVTDADVHAACAILGMKIDTFDYWAGLPKRHNVRWEYAVRKKVSSRGKRKGDKDEDEDEDEDGEDSDGEQKEKEKGEDIYEYIPVSSEAVAFCLKEPGKDAFRLLMQGKLEETMHDAGDNRLRRQIRRQTADDMESEGNSEEEDFDIMDVDRESPDWSDDDAELDELDAEQSKQEVNRLMKMLRHPKAS